MNETAKALPTMSVRAAPEHQALIRDLSRAIRTEPSLADLLRRLVAGVLDDKQAPPAAATIDPTSAAAAARAREWESIEEQMRDRTGDLQAPATALA
jgi:hypothetical protein